MHVRLDYLHKSEYNIEHYSKKCITVSLIFYGFVTVSEADNKNTNANAAASVADRKHHRVDNTKEDIYIIDLGRYFRDNM